MTLNLLDLLAAKEERAHRQEQLCQQFKQTLVSLTLNIPGANKTPTGSEQLLNWASRQLSFHFPLSYRQKYPLVTGFEILLVVNAPALAVKIFAQQLEETNDFCRLLDIDVFTNTYQRLSLRPQGRTCFFCNRPASLCIREQTHQLAELQTYSQALLQKFLATYCTAPNR